MKSLDIATIFLRRYGKAMPLTNLTLNKLVYYAQVESLRHDSQAPLFDDEIQAWDYGPVEPEVYHAFKQHGRDRILSIPQHMESTYAIDVVDTVFDKYGWMTAFDLVNYSHREGGAWKNVYDSQNSKTITIEDILHSDDVKDYPQQAGTFAHALSVTEQKFSNTLRLLGDA